MKEILIVKYIFRKNQYGFEIIESNSLYGTILRVKYEYEINQF